MIILMTMLMMVGAGTCIRSKFLAAVPGSLGPAACLAVVLVVLVLLVLVVLVVVLVENTRQNHSFGGTVKKPAVPDLFF